MWEGWLIRWSIYQGVGLSIAYIRIFMGVGGVPLATDKHPALSFLLIQSLVVVQ